MRNCTNSINGKWIPGNEKPVDLFNPADLNETIGSVNYADQSLVEQAVISARSAGKNWQVTPADLRIKLLSETLELIKSAKEEIAKTITRENGKTIIESRSEIDAALREGAYQLEFIGDNLTEAVGEHEIWYQPLGTALLITPSNFPLAAVIRKLIPALACGNTVILKPSEFTPQTAHILFECLIKAGLPPGVANLIHGKGAELGPHLVSSDINAISFTGSTIVGKILAKSIGDRDIPYQAEMGGKNAVAVFSDADIEEAAGSVINNGFACAGQWCTGTSRIIVEKAIKADFIKTLLEHVRRIVVGNGKDSSITMGPLVSQAQLEKVKSAVDLARQEGAKLLYGGSAPRGLSPGYYFEPTVFSEVTPSMHLANEEVFGPVLAILEAEDYIEAIELVNKTQYGLSVSAYTNDQQKAELFIRDVNSGLCHINLGTAFRDPAMPLTCWKDSGRGIPEAGRFARDFYTKTKAVYGRSQ